MKKKRRDAFMTKNYGNGIEGYANILVKILPTQVKWRIRAQIIGSSRLGEVPVKKIIANTKGDIFVDIGAHIGLHTLTARKNFKRIFAYEPHPRNYNRLKRYTHNFTHIQTYQIAISNFNGTTDLYIASVPGRHTLKDPHVIKHQAKNTLSVQVTKLSSKLSNEREIALIKVDVEGTEWEVLDGAKDIMNRIDGWIIELHDLNRKQELEKLLKEIGYTITWIDSNHIYAKRH